MAAVIVSGGNRSFASSLHRRRVLDRQPGRSGADWGGDGPKRRILRRRVCSDSVWGIRAADRLLR